MALLTVPILHDVFISCHSQDYPWVREWLLPRLEAAGFHVATRFYDGIIGEPELINVENLVAKSRQTVIVLSPAWIDNGLNQFEGLVSRSQDPVGKQRKVLPLVLKPCTIPAWLTPFTQADFTTEATRGKELKRLVRDLQYNVPPPPHPQLNKRRWGQWWLRYNRLNLRRGILGAVTLWLVASLLGQFFPFQPGPAWVAFSQRFPNALHVGGTEEVWLVGGANPGRLCDDVEKGLWRSENAGESWQAVSAPLQFTHPTDGCLLADIQGFAVSGGRFYMATSDVGLLRSDDDGRTWMKTTELPTAARMDIVVVAANPERADEVFVAVRGGGLYGSDDGGDSWERLDNRENKGCSDGFSLDRPMQTGDLLAFPGWVLIGTGEVDMDDMAPGLYRSQDGGNCWHMLVNSGPDDEYRHLIYAGTDRVYVQWRDWSKNPEEQPNRVGLVNLAAGSSSRELLWSTQQSIADLTATADRWYAVDTFGRVVAGSVSTVGQIMPLPSILRCMLLCDLSLWTADPSDPPLFLAGERLHRLEPQANWRHRYWP